MPTPVKELIVQNPSTGLEIARIPATSLTDLSAIVDRAREVQQLWSETPWVDRRRIIRRWHRILCDRADTMASAVQEEVGKPVSEAMAAEVLPSIDSVRWVCRYTERVLRNRRVGPGWQRWLFMPPAIIERRPMGVIGVLGAWNYPILLNVPVLAHALGVGNGVVWKPSEYAARAGQLVQETVEAAGFPEGLVGLVQGGPEVGAGLIASALDKAVFTGGLSNGRAVLGELGRSGIPAIAELSGFDAAIVLPDALRPSTDAALTWSAFVGSGQTCMAVKRIYAVGSIASDLGASIARRADRLRVGNPAESEVDLGPLIHQAARDDFHSKIVSAVNAGAKLLAGGGPIPGIGYFYRPTVLLAERGQEAPERVLEGCFGPVVIIREVGDREEAIAAVNDSSFGLGASVWGTNRRQAQEVGQRLQAGVVSINDATTVFAHASIPVGGVKASGYGRVHGAEGLLELTSPRVRVARRAGAPRPQIFPYSDRLMRQLMLYRRFVHRSR